MIQIQMFDCAGKPTDLAMRYVIPKQYKVTAHRKLYRKIWNTTDVHEAIGLWLKNSNAQIKVVW
jgi:hypothetical protein